MLEKMNEGHRDLLKKLLILLLIILAAYIAYRLAYYVAPFIIAYILSSLIEPVVRFFVKKVKIPRRLATVISLLLVFGIVGTGIGFIISNLIKEIIMVANTLPDYYEQFAENIEGFLAKGSAFYHWLPTEITDNIGTVISNFSNSLISIANSFVKGALATAISIPEAIVFVIVTILASYFISSDKKKISAFFIKQFPASWLNRIESMRRDFFSAFLGYVKAQLILMMITFTELFVGFTVIGIRYSLLLAFITSIVDALPILGTGTFLIPWSLYEMFFGTFRSGISLLILYAIVTVVRQFIEPKILGDQIGVYPLLTLLGLYAGLRIFGFFGLILGPIFILILKNVLAGIMNGRPFKDVFPVSSNRKGMQKHHR